MSRLRVGPHSTFDVRRRAAWLAPPVGVLRCVTPFVRVPGQQCGRALCWGTGGRPRVERVPPGREPARDAYLGELVPLSHSLPGAARSVLGEGGSLL